MLLHMATPSARECASLAKQRHRVGVVVDAVDQARAAQQAFVLEAEALVQRLRIQVVRADGKLDAGEAARP